MYANLRFHLKDVWGSVTERRSNLAESPGGACLSGGSQRPADEDGADAAWIQTLAAVHSGRTQIPQPWSDLFTPLVAGRIDDLMVIAQIGQSLDGRIATVSGHSHYINGADGLDHLHRLRAAVDAVVVGIGTALADDPQLTVRRVRGRSPARVVIDPRGRLPNTARVLADDGTRRIIVGALGVRTDLPAGVETIALDAVEGTLQPPDMLRALAERGLHRILIEGGSSTISRFLAARCLDRAHIVVAPILLGSGAPSLALPPVERVEQALHVRTRAHILTNEVLFDCDLSDYRVAVGWAKKST